MRWQHPAAGRSLGRQFSCFSLLWRGVAELLQGRRMIDESFVARDGFRGRGAGLGCGSLRAGEGTTTRRNFKCTPNPHPLPVPAGTGGRVLLGSAPRDACITERHISWPDETALGHGLGMEERGWCELAVLPGAANTLCLCLVVSPHFRLGILGFFPTSDLFSIISVRVAMHHFPLLSMHSVRGGEHGRAQI